MKVESILFKFYYIDVDIDCVCDEMRNVCEVCDEYVVVNEELFKEYEDKRKEKMIKDKTYLAFNRKIEVFKGMIFSYVLCVN